MNYKPYDLRLPYFKQGDDLGWILKQFKESGEVFKDSMVFEEHAKMMDRTAEILRTMSRHAEDGKITIGYADVHFISVECEEDLGGVLCEEGILSKSIEEEDEDETA